MWLHNAGEQITEKSCYLPIKNSLMMGLFGGIILTELVNCFVNNGITGVKYSGSYYGTCIALYPDLSAFYLTNDFV